eukprot:CAMPEP_0119548604 /NCGR_PEP_ID=MMETSP1352-20130426/2485_1 /TAXON_ID=265584 /ORGANISM="Stauroneis constricta, Strain CCMP1120" /LENGTH=69 /DNA_ID=CAMNT_0007593919 /DNA_START=89 /DNA_END=298 /DNA_ORIENTATION=-
MPWQSSATLFIIGGAFNVIAGLLGGIQYAAYGKPKELGLTGSPWKNQMSLRDADIERLMAQVKKEAATK